MNKIFKKIILKAIHIYEGVRLFSRLRSKFYFRNYKVLLGKNTKIVGLPKQIKVGENINVYDNVIMHFGHLANVEFGSKIIFSYNVILEVNQGLSIGSYVQIGEFTSIRDTTHQYAVDGIMMNQPDLSSSIVIGNNVWIGRNCLILGGTVIDDGVVVAANSVVKGHLSGDSIYGGAPAKFIKLRKLNHENEK